MKCPITLVSLLSLCIASYAINIPTGNDADGRIISTPSLVASPGQFPYMASVHAIGMFQCAGVIISVNWILTSAVCVYTFSPTISNVLVRVGGIKHDGVEPGRDEIAVNQIHPHSDFVYPGPENNIALLHLERNIVFNNLMQPATLANPTIPIDMGVNAIVMGWGGSTSPAVSQLQYNFGFVLTSIGVCASGAGISVPNNICTDGTAPNPGTCYLDHGGPLLQFSSVSGTVLYGITSLSFCGTLPWTFYESIVEHRGWIFSVSNV